MESALKPFQPRGVSVFNSAFETHLHNVLLSGVLAFLVLLELENVTDVLVYRHYSINKRSLDTYMLYSRISSLRSVVRTLQGVEWTSNQVATVPDSAFTPHHYRNSKEWPSAQASPPPLTKDYTRRGVPRPRRRFDRLLPPLFIRFTLLALQLLAIYSGTTTTRDVPVTSNFSLRLDNQTAERCSQDDSAQLCQEYICPTRGKEQLGSVLLCIDNQESRPFEAQRSQNTSLNFLFCADENRFEFIVRDHLAMESRVSVKTKIAFLSGEEAGVAPMRPDLSSEKETSVTLVKTVMVNALFNHGVSISPDDIRPSAPQRSGCVSYEYSCSFNQCTRSNLSDLVLDELRTLTLRRNETEKGVWLFSPATKSYKLEYEKSIAIVRSNRVAQGWFLIIWVALLLTRLTAHRWCCDFDEVAYPALKKVHGERMSVGPLAVTAHRAPLFVRKFSDGKVGHIGFCPASSHQLVTESFQGCEVVLGSGDTSSVLGT